MQIFHYIISFIVISLLIQSAIALILIFFIKPKTPQSLSGELKFDELVTDYSQLPSLLEYQCRDGSKQCYRYYPADSEKILILIHGSGWHSQYFLPLARYLSMNNTAAVFTPDLRGHGKSPQRRGDIDYINQLEDDLADFTDFVKSRHPQSQIIIGGHSSGGGLAVRFAGSRYGRKADSYLLLSPYLKYNAPTVKTNSGGWAYPNIPRIIGLIIFNRIGIRVFNTLPIIRFNMPEEYRNGTETLTQSYRLNMGNGPRNYRRDLRSVVPGSLLIAGSADESFNADAFRSVFREYCPGCMVVILDGISHMGIVMKEESWKEIERWLSQLQPS